MFSINVDLAYCMKIAIYGNKIEQNCVYFWI